MRWFRFAVLVLVVTVLQAGLLAHFDAKPDLLLILLVFFAIHCSTSEAVITSFTIGFAADIIGSAMGPQMISFGLLGTALAYLQRVIAVRKWPHQAVAIFTVGFLGGLLAHLLSFLKSEPAAPDIYTLFWTALYSAIVGPFLFPPSAWFMHIKTRRLSRR
jgi:rod shape-determining protein MreD